MISSNYFLPKTKVADADVIKNLIKLGQSADNTSLMIHKVGNTLFLDDFDIKTELLDKKSDSHRWFKFWVFIIKLLSYENNQVLLIKPYQSQF